jgi:hypothetical protein
MPVPWDALLPFAIIYGILYVGGEVIDKTYQWQHNGKVNDKNLWDHILSRNQKHGTSGGR